MDSVEGECAGAVRKITLQTSGGWGSWEKTSDAVIPSSSGNGRPIVLFRCISAVKILSFLLTII